MTAAGTDRLFLAIISERMLHFPIVHFRDVSSVGMSLPFKLAKQLISLISSIPGKFAPVSFVLFGQRLHDQFPPKHSQ